MRSKAPSRMGLALATSAVLHGALGEGGEELLRGGGQRRAEEQEEREAVEAAQTHRLEVVSAGVS